MRKQSKRREGNRGEEDEGEREREERERGYSTLLHVTLSERGESDLQYMLDQCLLSGES